MKKSIFDLNMHLYYRYIIELLVYCVSESILNILDENISQSVSKMIIVWLDLVLGIPQVLLSDIIRQR